MAVPRNRTSRHKRGTRRSHHAKEAVTVLVCKNCKASCLPHRMCMSCGFYKGQQVFTTVPA